MNYYNEFDYLQECFSYNPITGRLIWRNRPRQHFKGGAGWHNFNRQFAGRLAGAKASDGRYNVKLNGQCLKASRVVWALHVRTELLGYIDHIDGNPANDCVANLRVATPQQNTFNRAHTSSNSSGITGVTWHTPSAKWWARVTRDGKTYSLGLFPSVAAAARVVFAAKNKLFGGFVRG